MIPVIFNRITCERIHTVIFIFHYMNNKMFMVVKAKDLRNSVCNSLKNVFIVNN